MSAPHADRDHSEQPRNVCGHVLPPLTVDGKSCGSPHFCDRREGHGGGHTDGEAWWWPEPAREVRASEAQQVAAMDALDCGAYQNRRGVVVCVNEHHEHHGPWSERGCPVAAAVADAVVAAGDADEVTRLRAEVERLRASIDRARMERAQAEDAETEVVAERDRLAEVVARVEALFSGGPHTPCRTAWANGVECVEVPLDDLRAALSGPTPAETPQNGPEPALSREQGTSGQSGEGEALRGAESGEEAGR